MPTYTCSKCARVFKQKSGYTDHIEKKNDCAQNTMLSAVIEIKVNEAIRATKQKSDITKESLPAFFEDLHNLLWNKAGLSPERALDHMTFFFAYRLIEQQADTLGLPQECRWTFLASHKNDNDTYETMKKGCVSFQKNKITKPFFKKPEIDKVDIVFEIVQQINRISLKILQETDTLGDIFEYMLGRGMSTMSDEGQYFTNRAICKLAFKLAYDIKKNLRREDGSLCTFADWFCGTGGFPAEFVKGVKANIPVDWKKDSASVYCQDMNLSSVTTTLLNMLILTGIPFSGEKIRGSNSFSDPITTGARAPFDGLTVDYCFMNPPYGGDKNKGKEYKFAYSKKVKADDGSTSKKFFVNKEIQSIGIEDDNKVSAGVQLAMATLSKDGVCAIVLPDGFFFGASKKWVELRKKIAEEYKIWYVVDINVGMFVNTPGTKTAMMVFQKGVGPTEKVAFIGLDKKALVEATLAELRTKHYSLNYKQYLPQAAVEVGGCEMVKLGDIIELETGTYITKKTSEEGQYPVYGGGGISSYIAQHNRENKFVIAKDGVSEICARFVHGKFFLNHHGWTFHTTKENTNYQYVGHWLLNNQSSIYALAVGTAQKGINQEAFLSLEIPLPSLERQQQIVEAIDGWAGLAQHEEQALKILEKQMMFQVKEMGRGQARVKLGEVCEVNSGQSFRKEDIIPGDIPVIGGGKVVGYHNQSNRPGNEFSITRVGDCCLNWFYKPYMLTEHGFSITLKGDTSNKYLLNTIYYHFNSVKEDLMLQYDGTAQKLVTKTKLRDFDIPSFKIDEVTQLQSDFDEIRHKHAKIATYKAKAQEAIQRLIPTA